MKIRRRAKHLSFEVPHTTLRAIDEEAERMAEEDPHLRRAPSRSETARTLILEGLRFRAKRRTA